jgi:hypothetical protein
MWIAILTLTVIALIAGLGLGFAARKLPSNSSELVERVDAGRMLRQSSRPGKRSIYVRRAGTTPCAALLTCSGGIRFPNSRRERRRLPSPSSTNPSVLAAPTAARRARSTPSSGLTS